MSKCSVYIEISTISNNGKKLPGFRSLPVPLNPFIHFRSLLYFSCNCKFLNYKNYISGKLIFAKHSLKNSSKRMRKEILLKFRIIFEPLIYFLRNIFK